MRNLLMIISGIVALIFCGCTREYMVDGRQDGERLQMSIRVPSLTNGTATRAGGVAFEEGENTINSLYLLFFTPTADGNGEYIDYVEVAMPDNGTVDPADDVFEMNIDAPVDLSGTSLNVANAYHILALANVSQDFYVDGTVDAWMSQWTGKKENEVMLAARAAIPTAFSSNSLLMHGRMEKPAGENQVHLLLERDVVRFDVVNMMREGYDLLSVSVWNGYTATSIWETGIMDYSSAQNRTRYHYTFKNEDNIREGTADVPDDIRGGLYAFENQVFEPKVNDNMATCLIVQLRNRATKTTGYYRVNIISNATGSQALRRNNVYSVTITGVNGAGARDEETAYLGKSNKLIYTIGGWEMGDNGLIVRDEYSILSIPTKTVTIGKEAKDIELSVHTFTTLTSPEPLTVRSQTYRPVSDNIQARLDGNTLIISAKALGLAEEERSGVIVLSYAGLEISVNVIQSGVHDDYLRITLPDGGIPQFPAHAGSFSGLIAVQATGSWTAKLFQDGFSFNPSTALSPVEMITSTDNLVENDPDDRTVKKFRVYTHSFNTTERPRQAFIMITLDKDPDTYAAVVRVSQTNVKSLYVKLPSDNLDPNVPGRETAVTTFDAVGTPTAGNYDKFYVISGRNANDEILPWNGLLKMNGLNDDTSFFEIVDLKHNIADHLENYVIVKPKGTNLTGRELRATLRVQTDPGTFADITLIQQPLPFNLIPGSVSDVPTGGGMSQPITVDTHETLTWTATVMTISGTSTDGRRLVKHKATLVDESGNPLEEGQAYPAATKFRVKFPKVYYPNRNIFIQAKVEVKVGPQSKTITVNQIPLNMYTTGGGIYTNTSGGWGHSYPNTGDYNQYGILPYMNALNSGSVSYSEGPFSNKVRILHRTNYGMNGSTLWTNTNNYVANGDGVLFIGADYDGSAPIAGLNRFSSDWTFDGGGDPSTAVSGQHGDPNESKVAAFFWTKLTGITTSDSRAWDGNSSHTTRIPATATSVVKTRNGHGLVVIDPKNRIAYSGETQTCGYRDNFVWQRFWVYMAMTARWGSAFSDLLVEEDQDGMPAPWDDYWDDRANGGTDNRKDTFNKND